MKYENREEMKKQAVKLYLQGKTQKEISNLLGCSRNYVSNLVKGCSRKQFIVKIEKLHNKNRIVIPSALKEQLKISNDIDTDDYISLIVKDDEIMLKKYDK